MVEKVYEGGCAKFQYDEDLIGDIKITDLDGNKVVVPVADVVCFVANNMVEGNSSFMRAIVSNPNTEITHLSMSFEICKKIAKEWDERNGEIK